MTNHDNDPLYNSVEDIFGAGEEPEEPILEQQRKPNQPSQRYQQQNSNYTDDNYDEDINYEDIDDEDIDEEPDHPQQIQVHRRPRKKIRFQESHQSTHVSILEYITGISYMLMIMCVIIFITHMKPVKNFIVKNIDGVEYESMSMNAITTGFAVSLIGTCMGLQYYKSSWNS